MFSNDKRLYHDSIGFKKNRKSIVLKYSIVFAVLAALIYGLFFFSNGLSLVWSADARNQHCLSLAYYGEYLRTILSNIFIKHTFEIPMFDFSIGYGADIVSTLHYYAIGDPLNLLSVFFSAEKTEYLYSFLIILRMYLSGLTFSLFMQTKKNDVSAVCTGAIAYAFCGFSIFSSIRHPFFLTGMIYCPLVLMGIDKVFKKQSPVLYILSLALVVSANFYSAYVVCIFMVLYAVLVYINSYFKSGAKFFFSTVGKFALFTINGLLIPMVIFLPQVYNTLTTDRLNVDNQVDLIYKKSYYASLLDNITNSNSMLSWLIMGFTGVTVLGVIYVLLNFKKHRILTTSIALGAVFICFPVFGHIFNGFAYVTNRWCWILALISSACLVVFYNEFFDLNMKSKRKLFIAACVYFFCVCLVQKSRSELTMMMLVVMFIALGIVFYCDYAFSNKAFAKKLVSALVVFSVFMQALYVYSYKEGAIVDKYMFIDRTADYMIDDTSSKAVKLYGDDSEFYRYDTYQLYGYNDSLLNDMNSTSFFFSISNKNTSKFLKEIGLNMKFEQMYENTDNRMILQLLTGSKYRVGGNSMYKIGFYSKVDFTYDFYHDIATDKSGGSVKYYRGYSDNSSKTASDTFTLYETDYAMPMGYTYDTVMSREEYEKLSPIERQNVLLQTAVTDADTNLTNATIRNDVTGYNLFDYVTSLGGVEIVDNTFVVTKSDSVVQFTIPAEYDAEVYLEAIGFDVEFTSNADYVEEVYSTMADELSEMTGEKKERSKLSEKRFLRSEFYATDPEIVTVAASSSITDSASSFSYYTPAHSFYSGLDTYAVNLGYSPSEYFVETVETDNVISIQFSERGIYSFDELNICYQKLDNVKKDSKARTQDVLENVVISDSENKVSGTISLDETKILATQIPYSEGWSVKVDGKEAEVLNINTMFCGVLLDAGEHTVQFSYVTPYANLAVIFTVTGTIMLVATGVYYSLKKKKCKTQSKSTESESEI